MVDISKVNALISAIEDKIITTINKVTSWDSPSDAQIPSAKLVKDSLDEKVDTATIFKNGVFTTENTKANGTKTTIWNEEDGGGAMIIDGTSNVKAFTGVNEGSDGSNIYVQSYAVDKDSKVGTRININSTGAYYTSGKSNYSFSANDEIITKAGLDSAINGLDEDYYDKDATDDKFLTIDDGEITVEKQAQAETGYTSTYVIKQGGTAVGAKINIPKDFLLKSASKEVVGATPTELESENNLSTGDVYLKFIVNTIDDDEQEETLIVNVTDLLDNIVYTADESTITLSQSNEFSIPQNVVNSWLTDSDVEDTVEDYIEAITAGLSA